VGKERNRELGPSRGDLLGRGSRRTVVGKRRREERKEGWVSLEAWGASKETKRAHLGGIGLESEDLDLSIGCGKGEDRN